MQIDQIDGPTWAVILTALTTIGGSVAAVIRWARGQFNTFVGWAQPKLEGVIDSHVDLVETLKATQVESAGHIVQINTKLETVETTLHGHTQKLDRIEQRTCQTNAGHAGASVSHG